MSISLFPPITSNYVLAFQFSSWYPQFSKISIKSTIIRPLSEEFCEYLHSDSVFVPEGSEDLPTKSALSDDEKDDDDDDDEEIQPRYAFPELDLKIRECVKEYGAVFPKLNFSSPKDASWILPASSPLKCTSPSDVYLLLKSSDFISHDISEEHVFDGCEPESQDSRRPPYDLELVLRKWYAVDRSRELRCFVRQNVLLGISQRDPNYYEYLNEPTTCENLVNMIQRFWHTNIKSKWETIKDYTFDILLTRDLSRAHVLDFNPYAPRTDPLLFTYDELSLLLPSNESQEEQERTQHLPELKVIDSRTHPAANSNAPANQHNMIPFEALSLSNGKDIGEFAELWQDSIKKSI